MKKNIILMPLLLLTIITIISSSIVFGWYTYVDVYSNTIDAQTETIVLKKTLSIGKDSSDSYSISNLAFFDLDNDLDFEQEYLDSMSYCLEIVVENKSSVDVTSEITFTSTPQSTTIYLNKTSDTTVQSSKTYYTYDSTSKTCSISALAEGTSLTSLELYEAGDKKDSSIEVEMSNSYVDCVILEEKILTGENKISLKTKYNDTSRNTLKFNLEKDAKKSLYLYLFGIQKIASSNNDFLSKDHSFNINIKAYDKESE